MSNSSAILLVAFNARYAHTAFGARYLLANLGDLRNQAALIEFDLSEQPRIAAEKILQHNPRIVALGCYIWNIDLVTKTAALLKRLRPEIIITLGGPEISYETERQEIFNYADHIICGEGDVEFQNLCEGLLNGGPKPAKIIHALPIDVTAAELPYDEYTDEDLKHRAIYVEASRGCPFQCEYCMSSLDSKVRYFPEDKLLAAFERLLDRGATNFKFVDRTYNIDIDHALRLLQFFIERQRPGLMLHFEVIPDHLPDELFDAIKQFPPGMLQFEVGIQTFNTDVAKRIQRPLNIPSIKKNMQRLRNDTNVHIHSDLIAGLPGEDLASFEAGFNQLLALNPHEIQLGILKRLRGAPIDRHTVEWNMVYSPHAPYEILQTSTVSFEEMQRISRFARYWNLTVNNGHFIQSAPLIWQTTASPFTAFMNWSDWLYEQTNTTGNLHMVRLAKLLFDYLVGKKGIDETTVAQSLMHDYQQGNRPDIPKFLKKFGAEKSDGETTQGVKTKLPRQARHLNNECR